MRSDSRHRDHRANKKRSRVPAKLHIGHWDTSRAERGLQHNANGFSHLDREPGARRSLDPARRPWLVRIALVSSGRRRRPRRPRCESRCCHATLAAWAWLGLQRRSAQGGGASLWSCCSRLGRARAAWSSSPMSSRSDRRRVPARLASAPSARAWAASSACSAATTAGASIPASAAQRAWAASQRARARPASHDDGAQRGPQQVVPRAPSHRTPSSISPWLRGSR